VEPLRGGEVEEAGHNALHEEERGFLQERLALLGKVTLLVISPYLVVRTVAHVLGDSGSLLQITLLIGTLANFGNAISAGLVWLLCSWRPLRMGVLKVIDGYALYFFAIGSGVVSWHYRDDPFSIAAQGMMLTFAVLLRAVIVPSTAFRTLWISLPAYLPVFLVAYLAWASPEAALGAGTRVGRLALFIIRGLLGPVLAAITSKIIFGLRREVRKAKRLGQYQLEEKIGEGGMGEVYRARHAMLRRPTAVKLMRPELAGEQNLLRFQKEVQLTSQLTHPNTVAIYDYGRTPDGIFYYAMELLEGMNLQELGDAYGPMQPARVIHILRQVCGSLEEAHAAGLIHRDIKPANIILCQRGGVYDVAKVVDFGVVKQLEGVSGKAAGNALRGTPYYMSPESIRGTSLVDARLDLYAVGAVGYFLLTATSPFSGIDHQEVLRHHLETVPERPSDRLRAELPRDIEDLVLQCLEKDSDDRPPTARSLREKLAGCGASGKWTQAEAKAWWANVETVRPAAPSARRQVIDPTRRV